MLRVNGLFGHVRRNDINSSLLFAGFLFAFHFLALFAIYLPLRAIDSVSAYLKPAFAGTPYAGFTNIVFNIYAATTQNFSWYLVGVTGLGALLFIGQMLYYVGSVRSTARFRFVDQIAEPRLMRSVEMLSLAAGLPMPRVAVIDSRAMNAFACGVSQRDAVVVATRSLIDGLDDDQLAAVVAHELTHIRNGDIRLMAAANIFMKSMLLVQRQNPFRIENYKQAMLIVLLPFFFPVFMISGFFSQMAFRAGYLSRLLISSSREYIADAEAVRMTQNPAALVSALQMIDGRSAIAGLPPEQDAMMIDGATTGNHATHPRIADRIQALVAVTGSMAMIAPMRKDTRLHSVRESGGRVAQRAPIFAPGAARSAAAQRPTLSALMRVSADDERNMFGLTQQNSLLVLGALALVLVVHARSLGNLQTMADSVNGHDLLQIIDLKSLQNGGFVVDGAGDRQKTAEQAQTLGCFTTEPYEVGDRGLHQVDEPDPVGADGVSLKRYLGFARSSTAQVLDKASVGRSLAERGVAVKEYFEMRKSMLQVIHRFYGEPGLALANAAYTGPDHQIALDVLSERMQDPAFMQLFSKAEQAELELLTGSPESFVPCVAKQKHS